MRRIRRFKQIGQVSLAALLVGGTGCAEADDDSAGDGVMGSDSFQDDDPPIGCQTGTGGCEGDDDGQGDDESSVPLAPVGSPCDGTNQCVEGSVCAAPFEDGEPGSLVCTASCIAVDDQSAWCSDDDACCSGLCGPRGICEPDAGSTSG